MSLQMKLRQELPQLTLNKEPLVSGLHFPNQVQIAKCYDMTLDIRIWQENNQYIIIIALHFINNLDGNTDIFQHYF